MNREPGIPDAPVDFDWEAVAKNLDGETERIDEAREELGRIIRQVLQWLCLNNRRGRPHPRHQPWDTTVGRRCLCLAHALDPAILPGSPSLARLASSLGVSTEALSHWCRAVHAEFGIRHRTRRGRPPKAPRAKESF